MHMVRAAVPLRAVSSCRLVNNHLWSLERAHHDCLLTLSLQLFGQDPGFARTLTSLDLSGLPKLDDPCMVRFILAAAAIVPGAAVAQRLWKMHVMLRLLHLPSVPLQISAALFSHRASSPCNPPSHAPVRTANIVAERRCAVQ